MSSQCPRHQSQHFQGRKWRWCRQCPLERPLLLEFESVDTMLCRIGVLLWKKKFYLSNLVPSALIEAIFVVACRRRMATPISKNGWRSKQKNKCYNWNGRHFQTQWTCLVFLSFYKLCKCSISDDGKGIQILYNGAYLHKCFKKTMWFMLLRVHFRHAGSFFMSLVSNISQLVTEFFKRNIAIVW